jgi:glycosyltransferase involved in cell wall biosynthesis
MTSRGRDKAIVAGGSEHRKCYKNECQQGNRYCLNEIDSEAVFRYIYEILGIEVDKKEFIYKVSYPTISGYTTIYNGEEASMPYIEAIESIVPFCDEVIVLDGKSEDGTWEKLQKKYKDSKIVRLYQRKYDTDVPGIDGSQKAFARAFCSGEFCIQIDADQIFEDGEDFKVKEMAKSFPENADLMHILTIDYFGTTETVRKNKWYISNDYHMSRFFLSRNKDYITHGINVHAMITDGETGKLYAKEGMSDGCEYINIIDREMIPQFGPWDQSINSLRLTNPKEYKKRINELYKQWPKVHHVSWLSIERKIQHFIKFWDRQWQDLYNIPKEDRKKRWFEGYKEEDITKGDIIKEAEKLFERGGCHLKEGEKGELISLNVKPPEALKAWLQKLIKEWS